MNVRLLVVLVVALGAAGAAVITAQQWLVSQRAAVTTANPTIQVALPEVEILVAKNNLPAGTLVQPDHLRWQAWPDSDLPDHYLVNEDGTENNSFDHFLGTVVRSGIAAGEPITDGRVVRPGERGFLAAVLSPGRRAVTVSVDATSGISGFVFPGDRVDLILSHSIDRVDEDGVVRQASETFLTDIRVLAIDQDTDDQDSEPSIAKTITVEVTPKQAEKVTLIPDLGRLSLSLRALQVATTTTDDGQVLPAGLDQPARSHTWDTEVSVLLATPSTSLVVVRGAESEVIVAGGDAK